MSFRLVLDDCLSALQGSLVSDDTHAGTTTVTGVSIDSRSLQPGELYIALQGERFNGHDFIAAAEQAGAAAVLVHEEVETSLPQVKVADTEKALGDLARYWISQFDIPLVAVTGSNGKTTVKEIVTAILRQLGPVLSTRGNLNNHIGVPLTLLQMRELHDYAVIEMGASHAGEIAYLAAMARPDVAIITNIGTAHLEGFGSVEGIARAKSELFTALGEDGYAIINAEDRHADILREAASHCRRREFGLHEGVAVQGVPGNVLTIRSMGQTLSARFQLSGNHNGLNALAAVAAAQCLDVQPENIVRGLESVQPVPGRLEKKPGINGARLIDDSYNANPDSARQAVDVLARYDGKRYLVLGDMAELGHDADALHASIGAYARQQGLDGLWTTGPLSSSAYKAFAGSAPLAGRHFTDQESLIADLRTYMAADVTVLVKGSRSARMERVAKALMPYRKSAGSAEQSASGETTA